MLGYLNTCISLESHTLLEVADFSDFRNQKSREKSVVFDLSQQLKDLLSAEGIKHNNQIDIEGYTNRLTSIKPNPPFSRRLLPLLGLRFLRSVGLIVTLITWLRLHFSVFQTPSVNGLMFNKVSYFID